MIIGIDTYPIIVCGERGIGGYTRSISKALLRNNSSNKIVFLKWTEKSVNELLDCKNELDIYDISQCEDESQETKIVKFVKDCKLDVFYNPWVLNETISCYRKEWFGNIKLVGTNHDILMWLFRKQFLGSSEAICRFEALCESMNEYDLIFTNSERTKEDTKTEFRIANIENISMDGRYFEHLNVAETEQVSFLNRLGVKKKQYLLAVLAAHYTKNLEGLIYAYLKYYRLNPKADPLVICFKVGNALLREVVAYLKRNNFPTDIIKFTNYLTDEELDILYCNANWLIHPAIYEGFGMPVVEAWRHGVPVIASNNSSVGEIAGDATISVNPYDIDSIVDGIARANNCSETERQHYIELGRKRSQCFSWDKTAARFIELLHKYFD